MDGRLAKNYYYYCYYYYYYYFFYYCQFYRFSLLEAFFSSRLDVCFLQGNSQRRNTPVPLRFFCP